MATALSLLNHSQVETDDTRRFHADPTRGHPETEGPAHGREVLSFHLSIVTDVMADPTTLTQADIRTDGVESPEYDVVDEPDVPQDIPIRCVLDLNILSSIGRSPTGSTFEDLVVAGPDGMSSHLEPLETEKGTSISLSIYSLIVSLFIFYCFSVIFVFYLLLRRVAPF